MHGPQRHMLSFGNQLASDQRLKRTGVPHLGLREWDHDEYTGIADEIAQEITRQGGTASLEHLVEYISTNYGAAPNSIRSYASGDRFARRARANHYRSTVAPRTLPGHRTRRVDLPARQRLGVSTAGHPRPAARLRVPNVRGLRQRDRDLATGDKTPGS